MLAVVYVAGSSFNDIVSNAFCVTLNKTVCLLISRACLVAEVRGKVEVRLSVGMPRRCGGLER
jgi:hypothetical protein